MTVKQHPREIWVSVQNSKRLEMSGVGVTRRGFL